jgi:hypothetical protein
MPKFQQPASDRAGLSAVRGDEVAAVRGMPPTGSSGALHLRFSGRDVVN